MREIMDQIGKSLFKFRIDKNLKDHEIKIINSNAEFCSTDSELIKFQNLYLLLNPGAIERPDAGTFEIALKSLIEQRNELKDFFEKHKDDNNA